MRMVKLPTGDVIPDRRSENGDGTLVLRWLLGIFSALLLLLLSVNIAWMTRVDDKLSGVSVDFAAFKQIVADHSRRIGNLEDDLRRGGRTP